ncbi:MAG: radical SAM protein [Candidatus Pacearchaeota archaeon]|nr:radical SAM protein [Candidatus Pacearchaeota archaeon]
MEKKSIYVAQFGTGSNINLLPLAAGQLVSRLKQEKELLEDCSLEEIIFRRDNPQKLVSKMKPVLTAGFSCFLWNTNHSLAVGNEVKKRFPKSLIVFGGPSIPKESALSYEFFEKNPFIDVICIDEGEEVFAQLCKAQLEGKPFDSIPGIIYRDKKNRKLIENPLKGHLDLSKLPSPYVDGTFDEFYAKHGSEFSGAIIETNRGCPYKCSYCTWGNQPFHQLREKTNETVRKEIEWIGKNKVNYIAMADANFGIRARDIDFAKMLAECKEKYGVPNFISVSWVKNSSKKVLEIADILKKADVGFKITLSLQSLNPEVVKAINRVNIKQEDYDRIKDAYRKENMYSYTELIFGLPMESYESYISGIENSLSESILDQLYVYPLFLFPNTQIGSKESREKYGIKSRKVECVYTKSKVSNEIKEEVEIVTGNNAMPEDRWRDAFTVGYHTIALHDDRLAFFIFHYLKREFGVKITDLETYAREMSAKENENLPIIRSSFLRLENLARDIQDKSIDYLIRPRTYGNIPFDPPEGTFLELMLDKSKFYSEFFEITKSYLKSKSRLFVKSKLKDLFKFQEAVIANLDGKKEDSVELQYDWISYFSPSFHLPRKELEYSPSRLTIVDANPSHGNSQEFLKNHFDVRGVPCFNPIYNSNGELVFPPVQMQHLKIPTSWSENG